MRKSVENASVDLNLSVENENASMNVSGSEKVTFGNFDEAELKAATEACLLSGSGASVVFVGEKSNH